MESCHLPMCMRPQTSWKMNTALQTLRKKYHPAPSLLAGSSAVHLSSLLVSLHRSVSSTLSLSLLPAHVAHPPSAASHSCFRVFNKLSTSLGHPISIFRCDLISKLNGSIYSFLHIPPRHPQHLKLSTSKTELRHLSPQPAPTQYHLSLTNSSSIPTLLPSGKP